MIRTFIAVEIPEAVRRDLGKVQSSCQTSLGEEWSPRVTSSPIQWVKAESLHVTVKFLGNIPEEQIPAIEQVLFDIGQRHQSFPLNFEGLDVFPDRRAPRILWVGISGMLSHLESVVKDVDDCLAELGFPRESRPFRPHLTLAKIKKNHRLFGTLLTKTGLLHHSAVVDTFQVSSLSLMKSVLHPSGSVYSTLCSGSLLDVP